jgi:hypothetical protein
LPAVRRLDSMSGGEAPSTPCPAAELPWRVASIRILPHLSVCGRPRSGGRG